MLLVASILSLENKDFDLTNGNKYQFTYQKDGIYKFYTKANFGQNVTLAFYTKMITESPFSYINIYEYSNRYDEIANFKNNPSNITIKGGYTDSVTLASNIVNLYDTNYIAFEVSPKTEIKYDANVQIDVIDGVYDLSNGKSKKINNIKSGGIYIFYVPANEEQKVNINITTNYITNNPFNRLEISEYLLRENHFNDKVTTNQVITETTKTSNNELISTFSYTVSPDTYSIYYHNYKVANYIALKIIPSNITYLIVQFDVLAYYYKLNNGDFTLTNLKAETTYSFNMKIDKCQLANLSLEINTNNEKPFNYVNIYEYADNSYAYEDKENKTILFSRKDDILITSFSYMLKSVLKKTNTIFINIKPLFDINSLKIKKNIMGGIIELSNNTLKEITNLEIGFPHYFSIKTENFQKITFNIVIDNINAIPFENVVINEYDYRGIKESYPAKKTDKKISFSSSNNQLISTFSYIVSKSYTSETVLNINNTINIDHMNIKIEIENIYYEFYYSEKTIYNLKAGNQYYLYKHAYGQGYNTVYLDLTMDYINDNPFGLVKIYEHDFSFEYENKDDSIISYPDIKKNKTNGLLILSSSYKIIDKYSSNVVYELTPNYNISYLKVKYEGKYEKNENNETNEKNETNENTENNEIKDSKNKKEVYIYVSVGLASLVLIIIIIICIIGIINRNKSQNLYYSSLEAPQQSLIPI